LLQQGWSNMFILEEHVAPVKSQGGKLILTSYLSHLVCFFGQTAQSMARSAARLRFPP
jgi:hypothetical protein